MDRTEAKRMEEHFSRLKTMAFEKGDIRDGRRYAGLETAYYLESIGKVTKLLEGE